MHTLSGILKGDERLLVRAARAGAVYAILVFGVGFVLGTIRILVLVPRMTPASAVLLETPIILGVSWWLCGQCVARFAISRARRARLTMGLVAFMVLMLEELTLSVVLFGKSVDGYLASLTTLAGTMGLAAQLGFATFPLLQASRKRSRR